jgi:hypothetical protein
MKTIKSCLSVLFAFGLIGVTGVAVAADGIFLKEQIAPDYCHLKFPAMQERTLSSDHPVLKDPKTGDIIDFYGSCDDDPLGKDQVAAQKFVDEQRSFMA